MPWERSRSATGESFRSEPVTAVAHGPEHQRDGAHAGPADAHDMDALGHARGPARPAPSGVSAGMGIHQLGDAGGRVGVSVPTSRLTHGLQAFGIGQERIELQGEAAFRRTRDRGLAPPRPCRPEPGRCGSGGRAGRRAAGRGWPARRPSGSRPPSWRRLGRHRRRRRCRSRAYRPRRAPPGSADRASSSPPAVPPAVSPFDARRSPHSHVDPVTWYSVRSAQPAQHPRPGRPRRG